MKIKLLLLFFLPLISFSQTKIGNTILGLSTIHSFGNSVAYSLDGKYVAIGAPGTGNDSYARIYKLENNIWTQVGNDIQSSSILERVGSSIALSSDGSIVAIGARQAGNLDNGHVRVYKLENNVWTQIGSDIIGEAWFDEAGSSIALSRNGGIIAIGAPLNDGNGSKSGQVRVYKLDNNSWVQIGTDIDGNAAGDEFGSSVSISYKGDIIAIGSYKGSSIKGYIKVFKNENNIWTQLGSDIIGEVGGDYLGYDVSLSNNGLTLASFDARGNNANPQHVRVFKFENNTWISKGNPISVDKTNSIEGSISISGDGSIIVFGQKSKKKVIAYKFENNDWVKKGNSITSGTSFGFDVSLSSDGTKVVIGVPSADHSGQNNVGAAEVYNLLGVLSVNKYILSTQIKTYPNPVLDKLTITFSNNNALKKATIFNQHGKVILESKKKELNLSKLFTGIYLIEIETNKGSITKKIFKK